MPEEPQRTRLTRMFAPTKPVTRRWCRWSSILRRFRMRNYWKFSGPITIRRRGIGKVPTFRMSCEVIRAENFVSDAAEFILRQARAALAERDEFRLALSGGNTPRPVYLEFARIAH